MTFRVTNLLIALVIICDHFRESDSQDTILPPLPLGQFRFLAPFPGVSFPVAEATNASTVSNAVLDRPRLDKSVPAGVDSAAIAAQEDAILAFIRSCPSQMASAGLRCACAQPGGRCLDPYSLCSLENKCVCNGKLAYPDSSGKRCIPYVISTTTIPTTTTTRPTTTTAKTTTTTMPVTTTRTTTTTTMTTTTTLPPNTFADCPANSDPANPTVTTRTLGLTDTYVIISGGYPSTSTKSGLDCSYVFKPPPGEAILFQFVEVDIDHGTGTCLSYLSIYQVSEDKFCNTSPPPGTIEFPKPINPTLNVRINSGITKPHKYKVIVSVAPSA